MKSRPIFLVFFRYSWCDGWTDQVRRLILQGDEAQQGKSRDGMSELEMAGAEMREADERARRRQQLYGRTDHDREEGGVRLRAGRGLDDRNSSYGVRAPT